MTTTTEDLSVFIVDDHGLLRGVMAIALESMDGVRVAGQAANGRQAVEAVVKIRPDVVLMDIVMPLLDGLEATRRIQRECPQTRIVVLTAAARVETVFDVLRAGAVGLVSKAAELAELERAIRAVARGETYISPELAGPLLVSLAVRSDLDRQDGLALLSGREREVIQLIGEGQSTREIAGGLVISPKTVAQHKANIVKKLGLQGAQDLQLFAAKQSLVLQTVQ